MNLLRTAARDRRASQRGSVLSALLIVVAFLAILAGALMTELTNSFLMSQNLVQRVQLEATDTSAVELGIHQLQNGPVPAVCARDARGPWFVNLNGSPAAVTPACVAIVPDQVAALVGGAFNVDGVLDTTLGRSRYVVGDGAGRLTGYNFGRTSALWSVATGGRETAPPLPMVDADGFASLMIPAASSSGSCAGHCVLSFHNSAATPSLHCVMPASATVTASPAVEVSAGTPNFPDYVFFGDSAGNLFVNDGADDHSCARRASATTSGAVVGPPLVLTGSVVSKSHTTTTSDEVFLLVSNGTATSLQEWTYSESVDNTGALTTSLTLTATLGLTSQVGGSSAGYDVRSPIPAVGTTLSLAVAGTTGRVALVSISVTTGPSYSMSVAGTTTVGGSISRPPQWCRCPGQDLIGIGSTNGTLYLLSTSLTTLWTYDGQADGRPPIATTPVADANGDWYFGADDGYVYDVEIPPSGNQMFKAARFGPGGAVRSSPIEGGPAQGCAAAACVYFGSTTAGGYFAQIGSVRVLDLRACITASAGSIICAQNPRLWARAEVGPPAVVGGSGVLVQAWSYYSP